jgi:hypothetical protein
VAVPVAVEDLALVLADPAVRAVEVDLDPAQAAGVLEAADRVDRDLDLEVVVPAQAVEVLEAADRVDRDLDLEVAVLAVEADLDPAQAAEVLEAADRVDRASDLAGAAASDLAAVAVRVEAQDREVRAAEVESPASG